MNPDRPIDAPRADNAVVIPRGALDDYLVTMIEQRILCHMIQIFDVNIIEKITSKTQFKYRG